MSQDGTFEEGKTKSADSERQAAKSARDRAIANGTYVKTPLEQAKEVIVAQPEPDLKALEGHPELTASLTDDHRKHLATFISNLRQKRKKEKEEQVRRREEQLSYEEKGKYFVAQKTNELQQSLLMQMSREDRASLIEESINQNLWMFLEYMEKQQEPSGDFLEIIIDLKGKLDPVSFTEVFVRLCSF